jgi:hypothetical protein
VLPGFVSIAAVHVWVIFYQAYALLFRRWTFALFAVANLCLSVLLPAFNQSSRYLAVMAWIAVCYHGWLYVLRFVLFLLARWRWSNTLCTTNVSCAIAACSGR